MVNCGCLRAKNWIVKLVFTQLSSLLNNFSGRIMFNYIDTKGIIWLIVYYIFIIYSILINYVTHFSARSSWRLLRRCWQRKIQFPMAFSTTVLAWSMLEFGHLMSSEHEHALMGYMLFPEGHECPWKSCCFSW